MTMALELTVRHGTVLSTELKVRMPSPTLKPRLQRQSSETPHSPTDTPRKNKRKLSEPKRRTTDFSIKRLCPDSPGSACSESGRSDESTPERVRDDSSDSVEIDSSSEILGDRFNPHLRPPFLFPKLGQQPYFIPQFYFNHYPSGIPVDEPSLPMPHFHVGLHSGNNSVSSAPINVPCIPFRPNSNSSQDKLSKPVAVASNVTSQTNHTPAISKQTICQTLSSPKHNQDDADEDDDESSPESSTGDKKGRTNYKNMTRERRVEANARERSRVHTISAAFDGLRRAVPSYSYNQKLSKLAILRIACSYINALTKLADADDGVPHLRDMSFAQCVDIYTRTIQTEGKARRRH